MVSCVQIYVYGFRELTDKIAFNISITVFLFLSFEIGMRMRVQHQYLLISMQDNAVIMVKAIGEKFQNHFSSQLILAKFWNDSRIYASKCFILYIFPCFIENNS